MSDDSGIPRAGRATRRVLIGAGLAAGLLIVMLGTLGMLAVAGQYQAADYPGAMLVADRTMYRASPALAVRRDTSYRSSDPFPTIYNWYSQSFNLGPEARAQSACITLERSSGWAIFHQYVGVTLCDTPNGRMMFVQRSFIVRPPKR
jgi:hypothetical protein